MADMAVRSKSRGAMVGISRSIILRFVTSVTLARRPLEYAILMTGLAAQCLMDSNKFEKAVISGCFMPASGRSTVARVTMR